MRSALSSRPVRVAALLLTAAVSAYFCRVADLGNAPAVVFYSTLVLLSVSLWMLVPEAMLSMVPGALTLGRTLIALTVLLPLADYFFVKMQTRTIEATAPVYSFRDAKGNPKAFSAWWAHYVNEWSRPNGFKASTERPDSAGVLPFVMVPNSSGRFFDSEMKINNFGFRGRDIEFEKGNRFRIFALGESPTLGPTIRKEDRPWPLVLQDLIDTRMTCRRPVEVINAGAEFYTLKDNLERVRRDVVPLKPDLVISYHGHNGIRAGFMDNPSAEGIATTGQQLRKRPSALIQALRERLYLKKKQALVATLSDQDALRTKYADLYRELIDLAHRNRFGLVLANSSMVVNGSSPQEVREFYGNTFPGIDITIAQNLAHNQMVKTLAESSGLAFIDTTPNLDGVWDADLYLDLVHFTQNGNDLIAGHMFDGIAPILQEDETLKCVRRDR